PPPLHAEAGLQRPRRIIEAAVDDLAVARGDPLPDRRLLLQHQHRQAAVGQSPAAGEADGAGSDDHGVEVEAHPFEPYSAAARASKQCINLPTARSKLACSIMSSSRDLKAKSMKNSTRVPSG